jgi:hypothetical protein
MSACGCGAKVKHSPLLTIGDILQIRIDGSESIALPIDRGHRTPANYARLVSHCWRALER